MRETVAYVHKDTEKEGGDTGLKAYKWCGQANGGLQQKAGRGV